MVEIIGDSLYYDNNPIPIDRVLENLLVKYKRMSKQSTTKNLR